MNEQDKKKINPDMQTLVKIGSILSHVEEIMTSQGHKFDVVAIKSLIEDEDVQKWLSTMRKMALLPKKREKLL